jgi:hypothetical protein
MSAFTHMSVTDIGSQNYDIGVFSISGAPISGKTPISEVARIQMIYMNITMLLHRYKMNFYSSYMCHYRDMDVIPSVNSTVLIPEKLAIISTTLFFTN